MAFIRSECCAEVAQLVEHSLGKTGVTGSNPVLGSLKNRPKRRFYHQDNPLLSGNFQSHFLSINLKHKRHRIVKPVLKIKVLGGALRTN
jgi:hypothetical protein